MSNILIIPSDGEQLDHLRQSLMTWKTFGPEIDHVIVVGNVAGLKAASLESRITFWPVAQLQNQPRLNNQRNLSAILGKNWPDDVTFIWTNDDIFLTRPFDLEELTRLSWHGLKGRRPIRSISKVAMATKTTIEMLEMKSLPTWNYELHLPLVIQPEERAAWFDLIPRNDGMQFRTWVMNHLAVTRPKLIDDVKIFKSHDKLPALGIYSTAKNMKPLSLRQLIRV